MSKMIYHPLHHEDMVHPHQSIFCCVRISRFKVVAILIITVLSVAFVTVACLSGGVLRRDSVCPSPSHSLFPQSTPVGYDHPTLGRIRYHHTKRRLPQCLVIGIRKAGTRAILQYLRVHPDIQAAPDEVHYFDDNVNFSKGIEWYKRHMPFSFNGQITMEKTPAYFHTPKVPQRVLAMNSSIKLILVVREPVERAISDYTQLWYKEADYPPFEEMVIDEETGDIKETYKAVKRSVYYKNMERWLTYFNLEQIHIVDGNKLIHHPYDEVYKVETFLGLQHKISKDNFVFNRTKGFFCLNVFGRNSQGRQKCLSSSKGRKHPYVQPDIIAQLKNYYKPFNEKFFRLVKRRFDW